MLDQSNISAIGYTRVSTEEQAREGVSLEAQREAILRYCELKGWPIDWVYEDAGISGRRADNRPSLNGAIDLACDQGAVLVVHSLSRLARSTIDFSRLIKRLEADGASLVSISEDINLTTPTGRAVAKIIMVMAELESEQTGERVRLAHAHRREREGKYWCASRHVPYGWRRDKHGTLVRHKPEARRCKQMLDWRAGGWSYGKIADRLNHLGVPTKQGGPSWTARTVNQIVKREAEHRKISIPKDISPLRGDAKKQAEIRRLYASGKCSMGQLAKKYGCHKTSIWRVVHGVGKTPAKK